MIAPMIARTSLLGAALLTFLLPSAARAVTEQNFLLQTTADLVAICDPPANDPLLQASVGFCQGFAVAAVQVQQQNDAASPPNLRLFCLPEPRPRRTEAIAAFVAWARADATRMAMNPIDATFRYLGERYPCPAAK